MKISKSKATILIILFCVAFIYTARFVLGPAKVTFLSHVSAARVKGNPQASVRITEYIDFQCPACARGAAVLKEYMIKYPSLIYLEVKYFPLSQMHPYALKSALYAECAARQNKFWAFQDLLIEKQAQWERLLNVDPMFQEMAQNANLDLNKLEACVNSDDTKSVVLREKTEGKSQGVDSTPTYFINGKMMVGPKPLREELDKYLGEKNH